MTSKKPFFHPANRTLKTVLILSTIFSTILLFGFIQASWDGAVKFLCGFYTVATGLFFLAQLYGFVVSQTQYSESVEAPKFTMLENEEAEWKY